MKTSDLGVAIPQTFHGRPLEVVGIRAYLERADALGFDSAWVVEQVLGAIPSLEPIELLTWAAALTRRIRLASAVLLTAVRSPVHTAKSLATLDVLSGGRLIVGVGLGANTRVYPAYGLTAARRAARFAEGLTVMRRLWTEPRVTLKGEFWQLEGVPMEPKPLQKPHPPLWFGGHHPHALRRAVAMGDGFLGAGSISTATFADEVRQLRALLAEGRGRPGFRVGKRELAAQVSVWGDVDACVEGLRQVRAAGAEFLMLNPVFDELEHLERFAADLAR